MQTLEPLFQHGVTLMLVAFRLAGVMLFSPVVAGASVPRSAKVFLVVMFAAAIYPSLDSQWHAPPDMSMLTLAQIMFTETLIGATVGFIVSIPIVAMQLGGNIMGMQMGLGLAQVYNPIMGGNSGAIDQIMFFLAVAVFVTLGGLDIMFMSLVQTYEHIPLGGMVLEATPMDLITGLMSSAYVLAMRVAAPVLSIMFLETVASGVLMKTIPQINILSIGFAIKAVAGLIALSGALIAIESVFIDELRNTLMLLMDWANSGAPVPATAGGQDG
jgi:flagellar biosynthetic protein FliR